MEGHPDRVRDQRIERVVALEPPSRILEDLPCDELPEVLERLVRFFPRPARAAGAEE